MRFRLKETPQGGARYACSYLGAVIAAAIAGLVSLVARPIVVPRTICENDDFGLCNGALVIIIFLIALFASFFLAAFLLRLGWQWAAWLMAGSLILIEIIIESSTLDFFWLLLVLPALATLITSELPAAHPKKTSSRHRTRQPTKVASRLRLIVLGIALAQFVVWFILLLVS